MNHMVMHNFLEKKPVFRVAMYKLVTTGEGGSKEELKRRIEVLSFPFDIQHLYFFFRFVNTSC